VDTTTWTGSRNLDTLVDFIVQGTHFFVLESRSIITFRAKAVPLLHTRLLQRTKSPGAPTLLFLTGAALRVADVTRVLKNNTLQGEKGAGIAKLFAKHFKLEEHVRYLKKTKIGSAVGTPGRVGKLLCDTGT
jgi:protein CMS1